MLCYLHGEPAPSYTDLLARIDYSVNLCSALQTCPKIEKKWVDR